MADDTGVVAGDEPLSTTYLPGDGTPATASAVSDDVLKDKETHPVLLAIIYFLGAIGLVALVGVIGVSAFRELPESVILLGSNAITGVIAGLTGILIGQKVAQ